MTDSIWRPDDTSRPFVDLVAARDGHQESLPRGGSVSVAPPPIPSESPAENGSPPADSGVSSSVVVAGKFKFVLMSPGATAGKFENHTRKYQAKNKKPIDAAKKFARRYFKEEGLVFVMRKVRSNTLLGYRVESISRKATNRPIRLHDREGNEFEAPFGQEQDVIKLVKLNRQQIWEHFWPGDPFVDGVGPSVKRASVKRTRTTKKTKPAVSAEPIQEILVAAC